MDEQSPTNAEIRLPKRVPSRRRVHKVDDADAGDSASSKPATIRAVAKAAGVSIATISRALQTPERLRPDTRERVEAAVRRLGYTPNVQARNLRTAQTRLIIALVPDIANPFFSEVVRGIERVAQQSGYSVLLGDTEHDPRRELNYAQLVRSRQADGLITMQPHIPKLAAEGRAPIVNACECVDDRSITSVSVDNVGGARAATDYLVALGHRRIAFILGPDGSPLSRDREKGFHDALANAGIAHDPRLTVRGDFSADSGIRAVAMLFAQNVEFSAIFCSNDEMAFGAISALHERRLNVPRDISVIGFDDIRLSRFFTPPLTTVSQPMAEIGMEAARLLIEILSGTNPPPLKRVFPTQLIIRASTAPVTR